MQTVLQTNKQRKRLRNSELVADCCYFTQVVDTQRQSHSCMLFHVPHRGCVHTRHSLCMCVSSCDYNSRSFGCVRDQRAASQQNNSVPPPFFPSLSPWWFSLPLLCVFFCPPFHTLLTLISVSLTSFLSSVCRPLPTPFDLSLLFPLLSLTSQSISCIYLHFPTCASVCSCLECKSLWSASLGNQGRTDPALVPMDWQRAFSVTHYFVIQGMDCHLVPN